MCRPNPIAAVCGVAPYAHIYGCIFRPPPWGGMALATYRKTQDKENPLRAFALAVLRNTIEPTAI